MATKDELKRQLERVNSEIQGIELLLNEHWDRTYLF